MFFYLFATLLLFNGLSISSIYAYIFTTYLFVFIKQNKFYLGFKTKTLVDAPFFVRGGFNVFLLAVQCFYRHQKRNLVWKPLFKKTSYFGFHRNSINNINKK